MLHSTETDADAPKFFDCVPGRERRLHGGGSGSNGWLLEVWPGEGCGMVVLMRHADAGYAEAVACAREQGLNLPMVNR